MTNYRLSAIEKISQTRRILENLTEQYPEDITLKTLAALTLHRMEFMNDMLESWLKDGIEEKWDAETVSNGKAACMGNIDSLELLVKDIKSELCKA